MFRVDDVNSLKDYLDFDLKRKSDLRKLDVLMAMCSRSSASISCSRYARLPSDRSLRKSAIVHLTQNAEPHRRLLLPAPSSFRGWQAARGQRV